MPSSLSPHTAASGRTRLGILSLMLMPLLSACGSGSDSSAGNAVQVLDGSGSTAIADNPVSGDFKFEQFQEHQLSLDLVPARSRLQGEIFVVKLHDRLGNTYYLGTAGDANQVNLKLSIPRNTLSLWLEVYTDQPAAGTYIEEIQL